MSQAETRILLVEDNPGDARLVELLLAEGGPADPVAVTTVPTLAEAETLVGGGGCDVVLLDLSLPDSQGLDTVQRVLDAAPDLPIVVLTGTADNALAVKAVQAGAQDYLVKGEGDGGTIHRAVTYAIERQRAEQALRQSEARFRALFAEAALGIVLTTADGRILESNPALTDMLDQPPEALAGQPMLDHIHPEDCDTLRQGLEAVAQANEASTQREVRLVRANGAVVWGRFSLSRVVDARDVLLYLVLMVEDITERREMEDSLRLAVSVFENTSEGIFVTDTARRILRVNPAFTVLTGYSADEALGQTPEFLSGGRHDEEFYPRLWEALERVGQWRGEVWNRRKSGELFAGWLNISAVRGRGGAGISHFVAVFSDITSRKQAEERLAYLANHDPLTNLANRILFTERLNRALVRARRADMMVGVLFVDLDGFKEVNDAHGHGLGDHMLQQVAERLQRAVRAGDTVARLAGDEFTIVLEDITDFRDAAVVAQGVIDRVGAPYSVDGVDVTVGCSVGISLFPDGGEDATSLVMAADRAMYQAKRAGHNAYRFFSEEMNSLAVERMTLVRDLHNALETEAFRVFYQPRVSLETGSIVGVEALVRLQHPTVGLLPPGQFLRTAEDEGLCSEIDNWVLRTATRQVQTWRRLAPDLRLTVNLSPQSLRLVGLPDMLQRLLREHDLPPEVLELEIKEADLMGERSVAQKRLTALQQAGMRLAIDDFGTGYSAFGMLRQLPIAGLTVAPSFLRNAVAETGDAQVVTAIIAVAQSLRLDVVGKGVETPQHLEFLRRHQCTVGQGFLFSRPLPAREVERLLGEGRSLLPAD